jgi:hypothetical protein
LSARKLDLLEKNICDAIKKAHKRYEQITGYWLFHAPEHFLQNFIFLEIAKSWEVYPEATRKKISEGMGKSPVGRPPSAKFRYDLVIWNKSSDKLRAVVEIKRCLSASQTVQKDADRIRNALKGQQKAKAAYLLLYSEVPIKKGSDALIQRFYGWSKKLDLHIVQATCLSQDEDSGWICGYSLMRAELSSKTALSTDKTS